MLDHISQGFPWFSPVLEQMLRDDNQIPRWYRQFVETGCFCKGKSPGRPRVSDDIIESVREAFQRSPRKSMARVSRELKDCD